MTPTQLQEIMEHRLECLEGLKNHFSYRDAQGQHSISIADNFSAMIEYLTAELGYAGNTDEKIEAFMIAAVKRAIKGFETMPPDDVIIAVLNHGEGSEGDGEGGE